MSGRAKANDNALIYRYAMTLTRGSRRTYEIQVLQSVVVDGRVVETPYNLTGVELRLSVTDMTTGTVVIEKSTADALQILARAQIGDDEGWADIHFVPADTEELDPDHYYQWECWIVTAGERDTIVDPSSFDIVERLTPIDDTPEAPAAIGEPAPQTIQERSFLWTWSATGKTDAVTIPLVGAMRDTSYCVGALIVDPVGDIVSILTAPSASRTTTTFVLEAEGVLLAGTTIDIILRDRA